MRNVFDQYTQPENRVTHAFMTALNEDRKLLGQFLREMLNITPPTSADNLLVLEQQYPGEDEPSEDDLERKGIPDGWIVDEEGWCVFIESKVISRLGNEQIVRHRNTAKRRGFDRITAVAIAPVLSASPPPETVFLEWRNVYGWLKRHGESEWASRAATFLEIAEAKLIDNQQLVEGALTMFSGFPFDSDRRFTYLEAKRVLGLAMLDLRQHRVLAKHLGMNPSAGGRPAITGRQAEAVWDFLTLSSRSEDDAFTKHPHLTLGINTHAVDVMVTIPNAINTAMRRRIINLGEDGFRDVIEKILANLAPLLASHPGAVPLFRGIQRRYPSQRSAPFIDARIEFDLRTAVSDHGAPKTQPRWLAAAYGSFVNKEGSNYQLQIGVVFRYENCPELKEAASLELVAKSWLACKPLIDLAD